MKNILFFLCFIMSTNTIAGSLYVDLIYDEGKLNIPLESGWFKKLISDEDRKVFLVVSVSKKNGIDGTEVLISPPMIMESFERTDDQIIRSKSENLRLLTSSFKNESEEIILKVEFFSVKKNQASAFTESLKSLASAYLAAQASPAVSGIVSAAMDTIQSILLQNREIYLTYKGGIPVSSSESQINLYFDNSGNIDDSKFDGADTSAAVVFNVTTTTEFVVNFSHAFKNQKVNLEEKSAYNLLVSAKGSANRKSACRKLQKTLKKRFSNQTTTDLLAIAINDLGWAQDETKFRCISSELAIKYNKDNGLSKIANCANEICAKTKETFLLLEGKVSSNVLKNITGVDIYEMSCKDDTKFTKIYRWSNVKRNHSGTSVQAYDIDSCITTANGNYSYTHTLSWLKGKLISHSCDLSENVASKCS